MIIRPLGLAFIGLALTNCATITAIKGSGIDKVEERGLKDFDTVEVEGAINLVILEKEQPSISIKSDDNLIDYVSTKVEGSTLKIKTECKDCEVKPTSRMTLTLAVKGLNQLTIKDQVQAQIKAALGDDLTIEAADAAQLEALGLKVEELNVTATDEAKLTLAGSTEDLDIDAEDQANINAKDLTVDDANVTASDASQLTLNVKDSLSANLSDSARLTLQREPEKSDTKVIDSATISRGH